VAHGTTPGLRVTGWTELTRERRLPLKGEVMVAVGQKVEAGTVVARSELPGNVQTVNLAARLSLDPARVASALVHPIGTFVKKGDVVAEGRSLFGLVSQKAEAPADGTIESVSSVTGQLILRERPIPIEVSAYVRGTVASVLPGEGAVVRTAGAFVQGVFGIGGETRGALVMAVDRPDAALEPHHLTEAMRGHVIVGGAYASFATLEKARAIGAAAVIVGGFDDRDLRALLGRDLGVAITGSEDIGLTLILTEGFGRLPIAQRTWSLLGLHTGRMASVSGATQIRAGVIRPEIVIPLDQAPERGPGSDRAQGLDPGVPVRIVRDPYFGRLGHVAELPSEAREIDSGARVRVVVVRCVDDGSEVMVPRANVEVLDR
jgi:biotin carboxyl carrier protein